MLMPDMATTTAPATETLLKIQHVSKRYRQVDALHDLNLEIPRGTIFGLIGPNGAGKTTLLRILASLLTPSSGQVWFAETEIKYAPSVVQRKIGYMPDFFGVYPDLTAAEYLDFYAGIHGIARRKRAGIVSDLLELVELTPKRNELVETLSRGMKQRLCLARALVHDPELLLLDEPASGLDPRARVELRELTRTLQSIGKTIIISSHILLEMAEMCTDLAILQAGQLILTGTVDMVTRQLSGSRLIEVRLLNTDTLEQALALLGAMPTITTVTHDAPLLIQFEFTGDDQALQQVLAQLIAHTIPVISFAPRSSGGRLEEVFMHITEGNK